MSRIVRQTKQERQHLCYYQTSNFDTSKGLKAGPTL